jgi:alkylation response protein AidB-like acyl-CoA dehydrogenase
MQFALRELAGLEEVAALPGLTDCGADLAETVLAQAAKFAGEVLDPLNRAGDREGARFSDGAVSAPKGFREAYRAFVEAGWNGLGAPAEFGGQGLPHVIALPVQEIWKSANLALCLAPMLTSGVIEALRIHGSPEQRRTWLPKLVSGEWTGTMNLTEPQAGSDLSAVRTSAVPEEGRYRIRGTKIFITWGEHDLAENIVHLVLARTPGAPEGVKGLSLFIVPKFLPGADGAPGERNEIRCVSIEHKLGIHASPTCMLAYGDGKGAVGWLVGEENRGLEYMFTMMNHARLAVGVDGLAIAERAYQHALDYARNRVQGREIGQRSGDRVAIIRHPDVRRMLLSMRSRTEAMRALAYFAAAALDKARHHPEAGERRLNQDLLDLLTPIVKAWCTEQGVEVASTGIQVHGGVGFIEETGAAQYLRDARITTIYEGTTGIQANDLVGRKIGHDRGETALALIGAMRRIDARLAAGGGELASTRVNLKESVDSLDLATRWIVQTLPADPRAAAAVSVPYLRLFGTALGGWMMARAALAAREKLGRPGADRDFLEAKLATARFYAEHELPQSAALAREVTLGADSVLALAPEKF